MTVTLARRLSALVLAAGLAAPAAAEDDWNFRVTPYLWAPTMDTTLDVGPNPPASGSTSLLEILDGALLLAGEADRGDVSLFGEFNYLNLGDQARGPAGAQAAINLEGVLLSAAGAWTAAEGEDWRLQPYAGGRYWTLDASVNFRRLPKASATLNWFDPFVGVRGLYDPTEKVTLTALANVGGFGLGSDLQWELLARAGYRFSDRVTAALGYRHLDVDFSDGSKLLDMTLTGPFLAFDVNF